MPKRRVNIRSYDAQPRAPSTVAGRGRRPRASEPPARDALQLVHLYAERGSPKYEKAALRWLERYLVEGSPRLQHFAEITASIAERELLN